MRGPKESIFEDTVLRLDFIFKSHRLGLEYPRIKFTPPIYHVLCDQRTGFFSLMNPSSLSFEWSPTYTLASIISPLEHMLTEPLLYASATYWKSCSNQLMLDMNLLAIQNPTLYYENARSHNERHQLSFYVPYTLENHKIVSKGVQRKALFLHWIGKIIARRFDDFGGVLDAWMRYVVPFCIGKANRNIESVR